MAAKPTGKTAEELEDEKKKEEEEKEKEEEEEPVYEDYEVSDIEEASQDPQTTLPPGAYKGPILMCQSKPYYKVYQMRSESSVLYTSKEIFLHRIRSSITAGTSRFIIGQMFHLV